MKAEEALLLLKGKVDQELLARNEYLATENEILKSKVQKPIRLTDSERIRLATIGKRIGLKALKGIACIVKPETILAWFRRLVPLARSSSGVTWKVRVPFVPAGKVPSWISRYCRPVCVSVFRISLSFRAVPFKKAVPAL